jgi:hypothetical protein
VTPENRRKQNASVERKKSHPERLFGSLKKLDSKRINRLWGRKTSVENIQGKMVLQSLIRKEELIMHEKIHQIAMRIRELREIDGPNH